MDFTGGLKLSAAVVACVWASGCASDPRVPTQPDAQVPAPTSCSPLAAAANPRLAVEYFARVGDDRLVVTRPASTTLFGNLRVFFGSADDYLQERAITDSERYKDGGSTQIAFDLDGDEAKVFFPNKLSPDGPPITEPVTFDVAGMARDISRAASDDAALQALHFKCL